MSKTAEQAKQAKASGQATVAEKGNDEQQLSSSPASAPQPPLPPPPPPKDRLSGLKENWKHDLVSSLIIFLIALPLSLGIAMASGVPPMAGLIAAVVGGMLLSQVNGSYVTISGPAAGLIVVILGTVDRLGGGEVGYHGALAACVISGLILALLGTFKAGKLADFVPSAVVHGMLAAIGLIIIIKQIPFLLGVQVAAKEPFHILLALPSMLASLNPQIAIIGLTSLLILVGHNMLAKGFLKKLPAPIIVVVVGAIMGTIFQMEAPHNYLWSGHSYTMVPQKILVTLPSNLSQAFVFPDFSKIATSAFWVSVMSITLIQGLETLLSCVAVDKLDPYKRKSNPSKDMAAVGACSVVSAAVGGLPMIAEIVRSTANIMAGARTRWSNFFHGLFILIAILFCTQLIHRIPLTALSAILIVTGYNLTAPAVWKKTRAIGIEQTIIFAVTVIATLATDLLVGVVLGILTKAVLHLLSGAPIRNFFKAQVSVLTINEKVIRVLIRPIAIFSNYLSIKSCLEKLPTSKHIVLDMQDMVLIDHTAIEHLHQFQQDYERSGGRVSIVGLEKLTARSNHPQAARRLINTDKQGKGSKLAVAG